MDWQLALVLMLGMVCVAMALGLPVAFAFLLSNLVGALIFLGGPAGVVSFIRGAMASIANYSLAPIPLFVLMGEILYHTGVAVLAIGAVDRVISRVPGRLSIVAVCGGTVFAAISGSTIANTAMLGRILLPEMRRRGYAPGMAMGSVMAVGGLAMLIPPSALTVLLGSLAKIPIAELLISGIVPGVLMSLLFFGYIMLRCRLDPSIAPSYRSEELYGRERWRPFLVYVVPLSSIFIVVVGSIFAGIAQPTDSAALGCVASAIAAAAYRRLTWRALLVALRETAKVTTMIFFIIAASQTFSQILAFSGATDGALKVLTTIEFTPVTAAVFMVAVLLVLGCFLDQVSMLLLTLPFFMPLAAALGMDQIWLGVLILIAMEVGMLTPPFGLLLFVMKGVTPYRGGMGQIYMAALPFIGIEFVVLALLIAVPSVATSLVRFL